MRIRIEKEIVFNEHRIIRSAEVEVQGTQSDVARVTSELCRQLDKNGHDLRIAQDVDREFANWMKTAHVPVDPIEALRTAWKAGAQWNA